MGKKIPSSRIGRTFQTVASEMVFEVIDGSEEDLDMKDELLSHPDSVQILSVANLSQHIRDAGSA